MAEGIEAAGTLNDAGEQRAFRQVELANIFAEVGLGGFAEAIDGEAAALAEGDLVGVHLEDLLLGEAMLELEGDDDFDDLALDALFRGEEEAARQLHGEGGSALAVVSVAEVVDDGADETDVVDAAVLEEVAVFNGGDGGDEVLRAARRR